MADYDCPNCGGIQYCPCDTCKPLHRQEITWKWLGGDGPIECGHCGHTMSPSDWMDYHYELRKLKLKYI